MPTDPFADWPPSSDFPSLLTDPKVSPVDRNDPTLRSIRRGAHCMIYAKTEDKLWDRHPQRALVMMQIRFDGLLGFPGGLIDPGEDTVEGLNRELKEEININPITTTVNDDDFICCHLAESETGTIVLHFFAKEVSIEEFKDIERRTLEAEEFGVETMGIVRVPLYTYAGSKGFPRFLTNSFCGNSHQQLLYTLYKREVMSFNELSKASEVANVYRAEGTTTLKKVSKGATVS